MLQPSAATRSGTKDALSFMRRLSCCSEAFQNSTASWGSWITSLAEDQLLAVSNRQSAVPNVSLICIHLFEILRWAEDGKEV